MMIGFLDNRAAEKRHAAAVAFMEETKHVEGRDYGWAFDYAKIVWDNAIRNYQAFDDKADSILKYLGGGAGLFALGLIAKYEQANRHIVVAALPSLAAAMVAVWFALRVRNPKKVAQLPTVKNAKDYTDHPEMPKPEESQAAFLGQWHLACENVTIAANKRAERLRIASLLYSIAIMLLALPVISALVGPQWMDILNRPVP